MEKKIGQRPEVLENIKQAIAAAEQERRDLRFTYNVNDFARGNIQVLKNDEFIADLDLYLLADTAGKNDEKLNLCMRLGEGALAEESDVRERALTLLLSAMECHLRKGDEDVILVLLRGLCHWLEFETEFLPGLAILHRRLEDVLVWLFNHAKWEGMETVAVLLRRIQTGRLKKNKAISSLTGGILQTLEKKSIVEKLTDGYLLENEQQLLFQNILHAIGHKAALYLLSRVIHSRTRNERLALLKLIATFGESAIPALNDCLKRNPPWAVVRNVINIISEIGIDAHFALIEQYLGHSDERVQYEMISCIVKLGGKMMKPRLLLGLGLVQDRLKIHIIRLLVEKPDNDEQVLTTLLALAAKKTTASFQSDCDLLLAVIAALKTFPCEKSVAQLNRMRKEYTGIKGADQLLLHIDEAIKVVEPKLRHLLQNVGDYQDLVSFDSDPMLQQQAQEKLRKIEEEVQKFVRAGDIKQAGELVYNQAMAAAKIKDFSVAELLRDRLLEINPMALAEVVQLGELIEEQKSTSITSHHLEIWSELYEEMTTEEFNELYYAMRQENYHRDDIVVRSGETDSNLYFLNSGYISLSCVVGGKEVFLKKMHPGNVLGGEQFFTPSVWTVTLRALGEIQVHVLDHGQFKNIAEDHPGIEEKLRAYCQRHARIPDLLKMSGDDRREYPRHEAVLQTSNVLLDPFGTKGRRSFKGELLDFSRQGLAFTIRISNTDTARLLLGRHVVTTIIVDEEELPQQNGVIVGVRLHEPIMQDFSVHVKLAKKIDDISFGKVMAAARRYQ